MSDSPLVSILTPTWNRADYLERVWQSIQCQTYSAIEWIIADDGSDDDTVARVTQFAACSLFPILLIQASVHIGKARMDNEAIASARGEFILWCDSDDYLLPQAIEQLLATWLSIRASDRGEYVGVTALCADEQGVISTSLPTAGVFDTTWNDLSEKFRVSGDMLYLTKASELKRLPFPEVDFVIPEGVTWTTLGHKRVRLLPEVLKINEYGTRNCISFSGKMEYSRGRAYAMATSERNLKVYAQSLSMRCWRLVTYIRYSIHGEIGVGDAIKLWGSNSSLPIFILMMPPAYILALKDRLQGKVRKTHRDFMRASKLVTMTYRQIGLKNTEIVFPSSIAQPALLVPK